MQLMVAKGHAVHVRNGEPLPLNWLDRLMRASRCNFFSGPNRPIGEMGKYASVEPLLTALDDPVDDVKVAAALALGELGERVTTSAPLENLLNCNNSTIRATAIRALGKLGTLASTHILMAS